MTRGFLKNALVLGLLTAIGPFAIDMYLPALPSIGVSLGVDQHRVLLTLTSFFITFALGQMVYGPLSDMFGRKGPIYAGTALFTAASIGCAFAQDIDTLIWLRAAQGLGGAAGMIIARAIVRDLHSGVDEARLLSLLMLVFSVSPLLAPSFGSGLVVLFNWRAVFWFVTAAGVLGLILTATSVRETRHAHLQAESTMMGVLRACWLLLRDKHFMLATLIGTFAISGFFVFLANSAFVMTTRYGLSPTGYSLVFSSNAAAFFAVSQLNGWLGKRFGLHRMVGPAVFGYFAAMVILLGLVAMGIDQLYVLEPMMFIGFGFLGIVLPVISVLALADHGAIAGTASSLMGTIQLVIGSGVMALSGKFADGSTLPMVAGIAACAILTFLFSLATPRQKAPVPVQAAGE